MNPNHENHPTSPRATSTKNTPLFFVMLVAGAALLAFYVGRQSVPVPMATVVESTVETKSETAKKSGADESGEHGKEKSALADVIKFEGDSAKLAGIRLTSPVLLPQKTNIPFNGQITANPNSVVRVSSLVPGRVTRLLVKQGDAVRRGQTVAVIESRAIGEAQSAYKQAVARLQNAEGNLSVVLRQAKAGLFSRAPVEVARKAQVEAAAEVREQATAVRQSQVAFDNAVRLAKVGSFASPALEAAGAQQSAAEEAAKAAQSALDNAQSSVEAAQSELERRKQQAAAGAYQSRPVEEARRAVVTARSARNVAQSEVATTRTNLSRAKALVVEGLVAQRDVEVAQNAFDTATANLESAQSDEATAQSELERQQKLAATNVAGAAEVQDAQSKVAAAQADVRTRTAEVSRAEAGVKLAAIALKREESVFGQGIANRREVSHARANLENARNALEKARQTVAVADAALKREISIFQQNLNNTAQVQTARAGYLSAQSDLQAARTALELFKSAPGRAASVPITAPISGIVQERSVAQGEVLETDAKLMTLVNLSEVAVEAALPERDIVHVRIGSPVRVTVDALPGQTFSGRITFLGSQLDPETRTLTARAIIVNDGRLRPGMFARATIETGSGALMVMVPRGAVQDMEDKKVVFVPAGKEGAYKAREVEAGANEGAMTIIKSGLKPGQRIVSEGAFVVKSQAMKSELAEE